MKYINSIINSKEIEKIRIKIRLLEEGENVVLKENEFSEIINYYIVEKEYNSAIHILDIAFENFPISKKIETSQCQIYIETGRYNAAKTILKKLHRNYPEDIAIILLLGVNYVNSGIINKSFYYFELAVKLAPKELKSSYLYYVSQTFINSGRFDIAINFLKRANELEPSNIDIMLDLAFSYEKVNDYSNGLSLYLKCIEFDYFSKELWYNIGIIFAKLNRYKKSIEAFDFAIAIDQDFVLPKLSKINILIKIRNYDKASGLLDELTEFENYESEYNYLRGLVFFYKKDFHNASLYFNKALKNGFNVKKISFLLTKSYCHTDIEKAKKIIFYELKKNSSSPKLLYFASKIMYKKDELSKSVHYIRKAIRIKPYQTKYWIQAADILMKAGHPKHACKVLLKARKYLYDCDKLYVKLASIAILCGQMGIAAKAIKKAISLDENAIKKFNYIHPNEFDVSVLLK